MKWILNYKRIPKVDAWIFISALVLFQGLIIPLSIYAYQQTKMIGVSLLIYLAMTFIFLDDRGKR